MQIFRPTDAISTLPEYEDEEEEAKLLEPSSPLAFVERLREAMPFLEEIGIGVRIELHPHEVGLPEDTAGQRDWGQVRWIVRVPRWARTWHL